MKKRIEKAAEEWMRPALMFAIFDCIDSMHEEERYRARFDALVNDTLSVETFILNSPALLKKYVREIVETVKEGNGAWDERALKDTPSNLPIPFDKVKHLL